ncbi:MAG: TraB/GumN family protein, partial [Sphingomonadaceae bacterium]
EEQGTFLIAGGAAHFAGENSVIDMLEKQGFSVKRVQ